MNIKKFKVVGVDNFGDEFWEEKREEISLDECVCKVFSEGIGRLVDECIVEGDNGLELEKSNFIEVLDECGFKVEDGEGKIWFGDDGGMIVREDELK